jgi:hypothetical protein
MNTVAHRKETPEYIQSDTELYIASLPNTYTTNITKVSIVCTAPFYLQQTIALYEYYTSNNIPCSIYIPGQAYILSALQAIGLADNDLRFEERHVHIKLKRPSTWRAALSAVRDIIALHFPPDPKQLVFAMPGMPDWFHYAFFSRIASLHNVVDYSIPSTGLTHTKIPTFYSRIWQLFANIVLRVHTSIYDLGYPGYNSLCWFDRQAHGVINIPLGVDSCRIAKYRKSIDVSEHKPLFLLVEDNDELHYKDYRRRILHFLSQVESLGFKVIIKPHPRTGCSPFLRESHFHILSSELPFQFYSLDHIQVICGFYSGCLHDSVLEGHEAFSLEPAFERMDPTAREWAITLLTTEQRLVASGEHITLVYSLEDFLSRLKQIAHNFYCR